MLRRWFERWGKLDSAKSLAEWLWWGITGVTGLTFSGLFAWASTTWEWYWSTFYLFGVALAFAAALLSFCLSVFLAGIGLAAARSPVRALASVPSPESTPLSALADVDRLDEAHRELGRRIDQLSTSLSDALKRVEKRILDVVQGLNKADSNQSELRSDIYRVLRARQALQTFDQQVEEIRAISDRLNGPGSGASNETN